jgi:hypothetical protein
MPLRFSRDKAIADYSSEMASVGHAPAHAPQLTQVAASMMRLSPFSEIAFTGHSPSQAPQLMQVSGLIL